MLERFLADLDRIRSDIDALPIVRRAICVVDRESSASGVIEFLMTSSVRRPWGTKSMWYVHVFATTAPDRGERSSWSFPVDRVAPIEAERWSVADLHGVLEAGAGIAVTIDNILIEPTGPLRPLVRGIRWRPL